MIARPMPHGDILGMAPPLTLSRAEADQIAGVTKAAIDAVADAPEIRELRAG